MSYFAHRGLILSTSKSTSTATGPHYSHHLRDMNLFRCYSHYYQCLFPEFPNHADFQLPICDLRPHPVEAKHNITGLITKYL